MRTVIAVGWWFVDHPVIATLGMWMGVGCVLAGIALRRRAAQHTPADVPGRSSAAAPVERRVDQLPAAAQRRTLPDPAWRYEVTARRPAVRPADAATRRLPWAAYAIAPAAPPDDAEAVDDSGGYHGRHHRRDEQETRS